MGGLCVHIDPESYAGGATQAAQVKG